MRAAPPHTRAHTQPCGCHPPPRLPVFPPTPCQILFEPPEALEAGLRELHDLWKLDRAALAASSPLHLSLAVKALGPNGPPKAF